MRSVDFCTLTFTQTVSKESLSRFGICENGSVSFINIATPPPFLVLFLSTGAWNPLSWYKLRYIVESSLVSVNASMLTSLLSTKFCSSCSRSEAVIEFILMAEMRRHLFVSISEPVLGWVDMGTALCLAAGDASVCLVSA